MQNTQVTDNFDQIIDQTAARLRDLIAKRDQLADQQRQIAAITADIQQRQEQLDLFQSPHTETAQQAPSAVVQRQGVKRYAGTGKPVKVRQQGARRHGGGRPFSETSKKMLEALAASEAATASEMAKKVGIPPARASSRMQSYMAAGYVQVATKTRRTIHATYTKTANVYELTELGKIKVNQFRETETATQTSAPGTQTPTQQQRATYESLTPALRRIYHRIAVQNYNYASLKEHSGIRESALDRYLRQLVRANLIRVDSVFHEGRLTDKTITVL